MDLIRPLTGEVFHIPLDEKKRVLGRNTKADLIFTSPHVSRHHCELKWHMYHKNLLIKNVSKSNSLHVGHENLKEGEAAIIHPGVWIGVGVPLDYMAKHKSNKQFIFLQASKREDASPKDTNGISFPNTQLLDPISKIPEHVEQEKIPTINLSAPKESLRPSSQTSSSIGASCESSPNQLVVKDVINVEEKDNAQKLVHIENLNIDIVSNESFATTKDPTVMEKLSELRKNLLNKLPGKSISNTSQDPPQKQSHICAMPMPHVPTRIHKNSTSLSDVSHLNTVNPTTPTSKESSKSRENNTLIEQIRSAKSESVREKSIESTADISTPVTVSSVTVKQEKTNISVSSTSVIQSSSKETHEPTKLSNNLKEDSDDDCMIIEPAETSQSSSLKRKTSVHPSSIPCKKLKLDEESIKAQFIIEELKKQIANEKVFKSIEKKAQKKVEQYALQQSFSPSSSETSITVKAEPNESPQRIPLLKTESLEEAPSLSNAKINVKQEKASPEKASIASDLQSDGDDSLETKERQQTEHTKPSPCSDVKKEIKEEPFDDSDAFEYSQINACILVSSDDEEPSAPTNDSFGPLAEEDDDDIIFLSQHGLNEPIENVQIKTETTSSPDCLDTPLNSPSPECSGLNSCVSLQAHSHAPSLQSPENPSVEESSEAEQNDLSSDDGLPDLETLFPCQKTTSDQFELGKLVEKLKKKHCNVSSAKPIDPITPPARYKNDSLKKQSSVSTNGPLESSKPQTGPKTAVVKPCEVRLQKLPTKMTKVLISPLQASPHRPKKKKSELKSKFSKAYDIDVIKRSLQPESKKKHHLVSRKPDPCPALPCRSSSAENISIQRNRKKTLDVPAGIAKTTNKNRSSHLLDEDLFENSLPKPSSFKIPKKKSNAEETPPVTRVLDGKNHFKPVLSYNKPKTPQILANPPIKKKSVHFPPEGRLHTARIISPRRKQPKGLKYDCMEFVYNVCRWNYDWLETYRACTTRGTVDKPPPLTTYNALPTLLTYESFKDYHCNFAGLMYHEVWESIFRDWNEGFRKNANPWTKSYASLVEEKHFFSGGLKMPLFYLNLVLVLSKEAVAHSRHPGEGSLLLVKFKVEEKKACYFAYVQGYTKKDYTNSLKAIAGPAPGASLYLHVVMSKSFIPKGVSSIEVQVSSISLLRNEFRRYKCLCDLSRTSLMADILKPVDLSVFACMNVNMVTDYINKIKLNSEQYAAVVEIAKKCIFDPEEVKISLIHGPPGTGKSQTITALVTQLVKYMKQHKKIFTHRRILLCAPSNAAIDTLTLKLLELKEVGIALNVVRVGVRSSMHQRVIPRAYTTLYQQEFFNMVCTSQNRSVSVEYANKKMLVDSTVSNYEMAARTNAPKAEQERLYGLKVNAMKAFKAFTDQCEKNLDPATKNQLYSHARKKVLQEAEVIVTTVGSCSQAVLTEPFDKYKGLNFACCIIDEAGQSAEIDTWQALNLGMKKFVLVGDHQQLPATILSHHARQNLHQSLFERFYHYLSAKDDGRKYVHTLHRQYRMDPEIMAWPSRHFYAGNLVCSPTILNQKPCQFKPYIVLDVVEGRETKRDNEISNEQEATLTANLIQAMDPHRENMSLGVITPYQEQKILIYKKLPRNTNVTVNTVNGFQGQERDIIICSFVRANSGSIGFVSDKQRLNVALTRAKRCCIIIGHLRSLSSSPDFKSLVDDAHARGVINVVTGSVVCDKQLLLRMVLNWNYNI